MFKEQLFISLRRPTTMTLMVSYVVATNSCNRIQPKKETIHPLKILEVLTYRVSGMMMDKVR